MDIDHVKGITIKRIRFRIILILLPALCSKYIYISKERTRGVYEYPIMKST